MAIRTGRNIKAVRDGVVARVRQAEGRAAVIAYGRAKRARNRVFTAAVSGGFAQFGVGSSLTPPATIGRARHISIGAGVVLGPYCNLIVDGDPAPDEVRIVLEDGVSIVGFCTISAFQSVVVGAGALFARSVYISDHNHAYADTSRSIKDQGITSIAPVVIGAGAWLGENVVVTPGVRIGVGAVIAANAVVRDDVPDFSLAVGIPARVVRSWAPTSDVRPVTAG